MSQAFEDGNKRAAYHTARYFLHKNGLGHVSPIEHDDEELAQHLVGHGEGTHSVEDTQNLFRSRLGRQARTASPIIPVNWDALAQSREHYVGEKPKDYDQEQWATIREREQEWDHAARHAMATGRMTPKEVVALGYRPSGHESGDQGWTPYEENTGKWRPLPQKLYHVTSNLPGVLQSGVLRSPSELDLNGSGRGLGGGSQDTISLTESPEEAQNIKRAILEGADVASGRLPIDRLVEMAQNGEGANEPWLKKMFGDHDWSQGNPRALDDLLLGRKPFYSHLLPDDHPLKGTSSWMAHHPAEEWAKHGYHPRDDAYALGTPGAPDYPLYTAQSVYRNLTPEEKAIEAFEWWRNPWAAMRGWSGGPSDPLFTSVDPQWFAKLNPEHVGIIETQPVPGAHGYPMSSLGEWRVPTGDAISISGVNGQPYPQHHEASHDYDPSWDYDVLDDQYEHPLVQRAQEVASRRWPGAEVHPVDLSAEGLAAKYIDGTYSKPVIVFDPFAHEKAAPEEVENSIRHELRHAEQESRGEDYEEGDAEHGWREGSVDPHRYVGDSAQGSTESQRSWHLTDKHDFALDPEYHPENNTTWGGDWPHKGLFVGEPESWFNGHNYVRPFVAEIEHPPLDGAFGGYSGEDFLPAEAFPHSTVRRVIPYSQYEKETFGGSYTKALDAPEGDVRQWTPEQVAAYKQQVNEYIKNERSDMLRDVCPRCADDYVSPGKPCPKCGYETDWDGNFYSRRTTNVLDPIHNELSPLVFLHPADERPHLKPKLRHWIIKTVFDILKKHGYDDPEAWATLCLTGSLTTYQFDTHSDCDVSLFVDSEAFPEWSRAELIGIMVSEFDGVTLPGTPFVMQCFVVGRGLKPQDLYKPGLRSGYDLMNDDWIIPPDPSRVYDVEKEMNADYTYALEVADKMDRLIRYEPDKAVQYYKQIHKRRMRDQTAGKGDFSQVNIVYKMLDNRGLFDKLRGLGVKVA